jgi:hypothetical protein
VIQIAKFTGMTRRAVYNVLEPQGSPRPTEPRHGGDTTNHEEISHEQQHREGT